MKILITAGGTIVKIDDVRHIGNFSSGSFPAKLATAAINRKNEVIYLHAKGAKLPAISSKKLKLVSYETYDDYTRELKQILVSKKMDVVMLGAAVSDFGVEPCQGKISSLKKNFTIKLFPLPKVIKSIKNWSKYPVFQVGFKLLSGVTDEELVEVAYKSGLDNHSDLTIANDLKKIKSGRGEVILVTPERGHIKLKEPDLSEHIIEFIEKRVKVRHFKTVVINDIKIIDRYRQEIELFRKLCRQLSQRGLMTDFFKGSKAGHGSLAWRVNGNSFLITARGSSKKKLTATGVVLVKSIDWKKRIITVVATDGQKASLNAVLVAAILEKFPKINSVVHTHSFIKNAPTSDFPQTPGTLEYANEPLKLFKKNVRVINIKDHGLIAIGGDLKETVKYVLR